LSDLNIATMAKRGTGYVPTLLTAKLATENPRVGVPAEYYLQAKASVSKAYNAHVPILFGTDLPVVPIAREWEEFLALQDAGLSAADALKSATVSAAAALGMADTLGSIEAGKTADVIAVAHDPRVDLHEMGKVIFVMKGGKTVRDDLRLRSAD
jgi:imidazolonepropionase-like amidohydrolase